MSVRPQKKVAWKYVNLYVVSIATSCVAWLLDIAGVNQHFIEIGWNFWFVYSTIFVLIASGLYLLYAVQPDLGAQLATWISSSGTTRIWDIVAIIFAFSFLIADSDYHRGGAILLAVSALQGLLIGERNPTVAP